jgi:glycosyltransferase involved in cell wall biosynthesis
MINVLIDTSPLRNQNAIRGVGVYTRSLAAALKQQSQVTVFEDEAALAPEIKPDVIHYPFFDLFFDTLPVIKKAPTVVTIHDVIPLVYPNEYPSGKKGKVRLLKQVVALKTAKAVITDSEASKKDIHHYLKIDLSKIHVVYLAATPELAAAKPSAIDQVKKSLELPEKYILYVGDINYNKNIPQLIKSLKFLPDDVHLVCVGKNFYPHDIPEWQWVETQIAMADVPNRVMFINDLASDSYESLAAIYSGALAYVQPSLYEGFGLPVLEAMQCRTPVVSTNSSSLIEVAGDHAVLTETSAESLAEGVSQVLSFSKTKRDQVIREAYKWSQTFSWDKTAQQTIAVYQQVIAG